MPGARPRRQSSSGPTTRPASPARSQRAAAPRGGDGGFAEISGKQSLVCDGSSTPRPARPTGTLLLDPSNITIATGANAFISAGDFTGTAASSTLNTTTLQTALASNNVIVDTTSAFASAGNIAVNNPVTWATGNSLELRAHNNITVATNATINATGAGALRLIANQDASGGGDVTINAALTATQRRHRDLRRQHHQRRRRHARRPPAWPAPMPAR